MVRFFISLTLLLLIGCGTSTEVADQEKSVFDPDVKPYTQTKRYKPDVNTSWQWQLQGVINTSYDVDMYDIDLFDTTKETIKTLHESGKKVICYFSAGSFESWREDAKSFPDELKGNKMDGWDELWLDISNEKLAPIMKARLDLAKKKGCDGVEPDNVDGYTNNTGFELSYEDQLAYNKFLANEARKRGLSVGLKNDLEQIKDLEPYFDFALNEQCHKYNECDQLSVFVKNAKPAFNAEYDHKYVDDINQRKLLCEDSKRLGLRTLVLPIALDDSFRYSCD